jgi:hypothetical protein
VYEVLTGFLSIFTLIYTKYVTVQPFYRFAHYATRASCRTVLYCPRSGQNRSSCRNKLGRRRRVIVPISPLKGNTFFLEFREVSHFRGLGSIPREERSDGRTHGVGAVGDKRAKPLALNDCISGFGVPPFTQGERMRRLNS